MDHGQRNVGCGSSPVKIAIKTFYFHNGPGHFSRNHIDLWLSSQFCVRLRVRSFSPISIGASVSHRHTHFTHGTHAQAFIQSGSFDEVKQIQKRLFNGFFRHILFLSLSRRNQQIHNCLRSRDTITTMNYGYIHLIRF